MSPIDFEAGLELGRQPPMQLLGGHMEKVRRITNTQGDAVNRGLKPVLSQLKIGAIK